jgi:hypothetical protein
MIDMDDDIFHRKHNEFDEALKPILEEWYLDRIKRSGLAPNDQSVFYGDVDDYLSHVHSVYDCAKNGMNPLEVWAPLPDLDKKVLRHFDAGSHEIVHGITNIAWSHISNSACIVVKAEHKIMDWTFHCDVEISGKVAVFCGSMAHDIDTETHIYKLNFEQIIQKFKEAEFVDTLKRI